MALKPLKDRVVAIVEKPLEKTKSGILLGEAKEKSAYAVVESVGPEVKVVKKGDKIVYKEYSTTEIKMDEKYRIITTSNSQNQLKLRFCFFVSRICITSSITCVLLYHTRIFCISQLLFYFSDHWK